MILLLPVPLLCVVFWIGGFAMVTLVAILENFQNANGSITLPAALRPYRVGSKNLSFDVTGRVGRSGHPR